MSSKHWTFLYSMARLTNAAEIATQHFMSSATSTVPATVQIAINALQTKNLTQTICMSDAAMSPTLNSSAGETGDGESDRLLMRLIPKIVGRKPFTGDIVAFRPPSGTDQDLLVRRVAAIEGEEMVSDDPEDKSFTLPADHFWVLADNEDLKPKQAEDSRTFGPLHINNIIGRIIYYVRSHTEHGPVENSKLVSRTDRAILEAELDVEEMLSTRC